MISKESVAHVADLARLSFTEQELQEFTGQLDEILGMVAQLDEVDTTGVPATTQSIALNNVMRPDEATAPMSPTALMQNVPTHKGTLIQVPAIIDKEED